MNLADRRKKLMFRATHRGTRENDILIGQFAAAQLDRLDADGLDRFERFLAEADQDLLDWHQRRRPLPDDLVDDPLLADFLAFAVDTTAI
ncbi:MAG: succinate dehydrogenase assembly factor 2 [Pseudomonadota bacterium]